MTVQRWGVGEQMGGLRGILKKREIKKNLETKDKECLARKLYPQLPPGGGGIELIHGLGECPRVMGPCFREFSWLLYMQFTLS